MVGRNAVFVDCTSLNILFKLQDKFVAALNYGDATDRLGETISVLGPGYDVYLCLKPRAEGEGDMVLEELSMIGLPFTVDTAELYQLLKFFRNSNGVGNVYLCNWLSAYIATARTDTFKSVFYYGNRVAKISVKDRILEEFSLYDSQLAFTESEGELYSGYGDVGLIDIDGLKAQYPELADGSKVQLTMVAPLVQAYRSPIKMDTDDLYDMLSRKYESGESLPEVKPKEVAEPRPMPEDPQTRPAKDLPEPPIKKEAGKTAKPEPVEKVPEVRKGSRTSAPAKLLVGVCAVLAFATGVSFRLSTGVKADTVHDSYFTEADETISNRQMLSDIYSNGISNMESLVEAFDYASGSFLGVTVLGFEYTQDGNIVRCACASQDIADAYESYLSEKYTVISTNDLGAASTDANTVQFSVLFI